MIGAAIGLAASAAVLYLWLRSRGRTTMLPSKGLEAKLGAALPSGGVSAAEPYAAAAPGWGAGVGPAVIGGSGAYTMLGVRRPSVIADPVREPPKPGPRGGYSPLPSPTGVVLDQIRHRGTQPGQPARFAAAKPSYALGHGAPARGGNLTTPGPQPHRQFERLTGYRTRDPVERSTAVTAPGKTKPAAAADPAW